MVVLCTFAQKLKSFFSFFYYGPGINKSIYHQKQGTFTMQNRSSFSVSRQGGEHEMEDTRERRRESRAPPLACGSPYALSSLSPCACSSGEGTTNFLIHVARGWKQICA